MNNTRVLFVIFVALVLQVSALVSQTTSNVHAPARSPQSMSELSVSLENSIVAQYLSDAAIAYGNTIGRYGSSLLSDEDNNKYLKHVEFHEVFTPGWTEQPQSVYIPADGGSTVELSDNPVFCDDAVLSFPVVKGVAEAYNLIPQKVYWYRVLTADKRVVYSGIFKTLGQLRMLKAENVLNIRDLGGWPVQDEYGNTIGHLAYGKLVRGATFDGYMSNYVPTPAITSFGISQLKSIGVNAEFDLRDDDEWVTQNPLECEEFQRETMEYYLNLFEKASLEKCQHVKLFLSFVKTQISAGRYAYYHCSAGADRTGCMSLIIEALCGVSEADIVKDWELTSFAVRGYNTSYTLGRIIDDSEMGYDKDGDGHKEAKAEMREVFNYLYDNYGGKSGSSFKNQIKAWLKDKVYTSNPSEVDELEIFFRNHLVVPESKSPTIIKEQSRESGSIENLVVYDGQNTSASTEGHWLNAAGEAELHDSYSISGYIDCSGYNKLLLNVNGRVSAVVYDAQKNVIGNIGDCNLDRESILFEYVEHSLEEFSGARYVRFNVPNYSGWTAVLSNQSYLTE